LRRNTCAMERSVKKIARPIAREHTPRAIRSMRSRGQSHDHQRSVWIAKPWYRSPPIDFIAVRTTLRRSDVFPPRHQPFATMTTDEFFMQNVKA
jgi:hypothetical protein